MYNHEPPDYICDFCGIAQGKETSINKKSDMVFEDEHTLAFISPKWWLHNPGHVMVIPRTHVENVYDISTELLGHVYTTGKHMALALKEAYACDGTSFRQHNEPAGNQAVWHFHLHVFPRWDGDELYINHARTHWPDEAERKLYADKVRLFLKVHNYPDDNKAVI